MDAVSASPSRKARMAARSLVGAAPRGSKNPDIESPQHEGTRPWISARSTLPLPKSPPPTCAAARAQPGAAASRRGDRQAVRSSGRRRRPSARPHPRVRRPGRLEHRLPLLRRVAVLAHGTRPRHCPGEGARGARARRLCRGWPGRSPAASCPPPRSGPSPASPRPRPKSASWASGARVPPSTSSASCVAGAGWTERPRPAMPPSSTRAAHYTCIRMKTAR
jgi:hypothetical protein